MKGLSKMAETTVDYIRGEKFATYFNTEPNEWVSAEEIELLEGKHDGN